MRTLRILLTFGILLTTAVGTLAWEDGEFEMFDLVEEVGQNFYEVLEIPQDSSPKDIKQAYRKLSLKLHPDKNPSPDAEVKFRQLVGIYEVLKDPTLRESYHQVLIDGLPNWRHPSYYYRRVRKLALWQVTVIVLVIVSIGQYLAGWAAYWEKKISFQEQIDATLRRTQRTRKAQKEYKDVHSSLQADVERLLKKPSPWDIAPFQLLRFGKYLIIGFPGDVVNFVKQWQAEKLEREASRAREAEILEQEKLAAEEPKKPRKRKIFQAPEKPEGEDSAYQPKWGRNEPEESDSTPAPPVIKGGLWTDEDLSELVKLCTKFPGGTPERWEKISFALGRQQAEVTFMAKRVLEKLSKKVEEAEEEPQTVTKVKVKTKGGKGDSLDSVKVENWTLEEQRSLEAALIVFPKSAVDRWEKIAHLVPGRSKEECMQRFKYVADLVRKNKEKKKEDEKETSEDAEIPTESQSVESDKKGLTEEQSGISTEKEELVRKEFLEKQGAAKRDSSSSSSDQDWCLVDKPNTS